VAKNLRETHPLPRNNLYTWEKTQGIRGSDWGVWSPPRLV